MVHKFIENHSRTEYEFEEFRIRLSSFFHTMKLVHGYEYLASANQFNASDARQYLTNKFVVQCRYFETEYNFTVNVDSSTPEYILDIKSQGEYIVQVRTIDIDDFFKALGNMYETLNVLIIDFLVAK